MKPLCTPLLILISSWKWHRKLAKDRFICKNIENSAHTFCFCCQRMRIYLINNVCRNCANITLGFFFWRATRSQVSAVQCLTFLLVAQWNSYLVAPESNFYFSVGQARWTLCIIASLKMIMKKSPGRIWGVFLSIFN